MRSGLARSVSVARTHGLGTSGRKTKDYRPARDVPVCIVLFIYLDIDNDEHAIDYVMLVLPRGGAWWGEINEA